MGLLVFCFDKIFNLCILPLLFVFFVCLFEKQTILPALVALWVWFCFTLIYFARQFKLLVPDPANILRYVWRSARKQNVPGWWQDGALGLFAGRKRGCFGVNCSACFNLKCKRNGSIRFGPVLLESREMGGEGMGAPGEPWGEAEAVQSPKSLGKRQARRGAHGHPGKRTNHPLLL